MRAPFAPSVFWGQKLFQDDALEVYTHTHFNSEPAHYTSGSGVCGQSLQRGPVTIWRFRTEALPDPFSSNTSKQLASPEAPAVCCRKPGGPGSWRWRLGKPTAQSDRSCSLMVSFDCQAHSTSIYLDYRGHCTGGEIEA